MSSMSCVQPDSQTHSRVVQFDMAESRKYEKTTDAAKNQYKSVADFYPPYTQQNAHKSEPHDFEWKRMPRHDNEFYKSKVQSMQVIDEFKKMPGEQKPKDVHLHALHVEEDRRVQQKWDDLDKHRQMVMAIADAKRQGIISANDDDYRTFMTEDQIRRYEETVRQQQDAQGENPNTIFDD